MSSILEVFLNKVSKICAIAPISLIDIGARGGIKQPWRKVPIEYLHLYGFDADVEECNRLNDANRSVDNIRYFPYALLDKESKRTLYWTEDGGSSSIYKPNCNFMNKFYYGDMWHIKKEIPVQTTTLNKVLDENNIKADFLKIDAQGAELKILEGANRSLDSALGLELEVEFVHIYEEQPLFCDVDSYVRKMGFELYDLNRHWASRSNMNYYNTNRGQLIFADAIYFRSIDSFYSLQYSTPKDKREQIIKMIIMFVIYGFFDVAMEFIHHTNSSFSEVEIEALGIAISDLSHYPKWQALLLNNRYANVLGKLFKHIGNALSFRSKTWGWGSDYSSVDGRYSYHTTGKLLGDFRK